MKLDRDLLHAMAATCTLSVLISWVLIRVPRDHQRVGSNLVCGEDELVLYAHRDEGSGLIVQRRFGGPSASIAADPKTGDISIHLANGPGQKSGVGLLATSRGLSSLSLFGRDGAVRSGLTTFPDGSTSLVMKDARGRDRVEVSVDVAGDARIILRDKDGAQTFGN